MDKRINIYDTEKPILNSSFRSLIWPSMFRRECPEAKEL